MKDQLRHASMRLTEWVAHNFEHFIVDSYVISFPKSGRTWLTSILRHYLESLYGSDMARMCIHREHKLHLPKLPILKQSFPIMLFTHDMANPPYQDTLAYNQIASVSNMWRYFAKQNIFLMRDPRDVLVSYYHHKLHLEKLFGQHMVGVPGTVEDFAADPVYGLPKIVEFMNLWAPVLTHHPDDFLVLRYEDLKNDIRIQASHLLTYLAGQVDRERLDQAIDWASFDRRKAAEIKLLKYRGINIHGNENALKVRKGVVGGYREEMNPDLIKLVDKFISEHLSPYYDNYIYDTFNQPETQSMYYQ